MYQIVIIGSGPGGYVAAIRAAQLGFKTALIEKYNSLGGTCLHVGCIPSKTLLASAHQAENSRNASALGIDIQGEVRANISKIMERKNNVIGQTSQGISFLMKKNNIAVFTGSAEFISPTQLKINKKDGSSESISAEKIIIATGSKPVNLFNSIDKKRIISSTEALSLEEIPNHLVVIGGGVIGVELGQVYRQLGAKVSIIEYAERILPTMEANLGKELSKNLKKQGIEIYTNTQVKSITSNENSVTIQAITSEKELTFEGDYCLISVGRFPYTEGLGLEKIGVKTNEKGQILVNDALQTSVENIYAIGDVIGGAMLAHKAEEEGVFVVERLAGQQPKIHYHLIPSVVYTHPEVASVGKTKSQLTNENKKFKTGTFPFKALGRARASQQTEGFVTILADAVTDEVLGVHIIGQGASELIAQAVTAMEFRASAEDMARICYSHPSFSEAIKEAALNAFENRAIHM